jgi:8-oxo-dGTP pyrophosphatase MutT (NUDIX family)
MTKKVVSAPRLDYSNPFMDVRHTRVDFGAFRKDYFVVDLGPRAGVVALRDGCVLLTKQYRFLVDDFVWELPGGRVDEGESAEIAAVRECLEETGIECSGLRKLIEYYPGLDNFNNRTTLFVSEEVREAGEFRAVASEVVEIRWFPLQEALDLVASGAILDALTVTGLLALRVAQLPVSPRP